MMEHSDMSCVLFFRLIIVIVVLGMSCGLFFRLIIMIVVLYLVFIFMLFILLPVHSMAANKQFETGLIMGQVWSKI